MTGKELIIYILQNNLENEPVIRDEKFVGFMSINDVAVKMGVGNDTVIAWILLDRIPCVKVGGRSYIPANFEQYLNEEGSKNV
jgi:predicted transcriptional regulator